MKKQLRLTPIAALLSAASFSTLIASPALAQSADTDSQEPTHGEAA